MSDDVPHAFIDAVLHQPPSCDNCGAPITTAYCVQLLPAGETIDARGAIYLCPNKTCLDAT